MLGKERKWNHTKCSVKKTKGRKRVEDNNNNQKKKKKTRDQGQQIINSAKYNRY